MIFQTLMSTASVETFIVVCNIPSSFHLFQKVWPSPRPHPPWMVSVAVPRGDEIQPLTARSNMIRLAKTTLICVVIAASAVTAFNAYGGSSSTRRVFVSESTAAAAAVAAVVALPRAGVANDTADPYVDYITSESGMKYLITKEGDGAVPSAGQLVKVRSLCPIVGQKTYCHSTVNT